VFEGFEVRTDAEQSENMFRGRVRMIKNLIICWVDERYLVQAELQW